MTAWVRWAVFAAAVVSPLVSAPAAAAASGAEAALAARYAPVVRLVDQPGQCGRGRPYVPIDVNLLFDEPTVALRGPWGGADLIKVAPTASDLAAGLYEYHLDFPGHALDPGCSYLLWSRRLNKGHKPAIYAHVATDPGYPGQLALQYWMFYVFNDWNNLHEGDWEMIQLNFHASTASQALLEKPTEVGYSQHEGGEKATWDDPKLEIVDGTHPVVYPADGSHANFYSEALYLGASGEQGVGCDDTRNAGLVTRPVVETIPSDPAAARAEFPWLGFQGRWGELQPAFFNGPTGPNLKTQWTRPIYWSQGWRDRAFGVPAGGALGTRTTDFFCGAMAGGSRLLWTAVSNPLPTVGGVLALLALVAFALSRATWRPTAPLRLARRRAWGQILAGAARMYASRLRLFIGLGVLLLPISVLITILQTIVLRASSIAGVETEGEAAGVFVLLVVAIGTALTLLGLGLVQAATVRALVEIDNGRPVGPVRAYRMALPKLLPLLAPIVIAVVVVSFLTTFVFLIPVAVWLAVRWALVVPVVALEDLGPIAALRRSSALVRGDWLKVASLTIVSAALALVAGPLIGTALIVLTNLPLGLLNIVAGLVYTLTMPFVALTTAYVYLDARVGDSLRPERTPAELPAQIELSAG
jgi:Vacuolar protein sorting-associated protein 62